MWCHDEDCQYLTWTDAHRVEDHPANQDGTRQSDGTLADQVFPDRWRHLHDEELAAEIDNGEHREDD